MQFRLWIFDLDGTLVDSLGDIAAALNHGLQSAGLAALPPETVRRFVGDGVKTLVARALAHHGAADVDAAAVTAAVVARYHDHACVLTRLYDGIAPTLQLLREAGAKLAVLTNKPASIARALIAGLPLAAPFDVVVGDGDGYPRKPDPAAAAALAARFGGSPAQTMMVGDGLPDLAMAQAFGCPVAAAGWGYTDREQLRAANPTYLVETPAQLLALARRLT